MVASPPENPQVIMTYESSSDDIVVNFPTSSLPQVELGTDHSSSSPSLDST